MESIHLSGPAVNDPWDVDRTVPDFHPVGSRRNTCDTKGPIRVGDSVEGMPVDPDVGLHPAMNVTFDDQITRAIRQFDQP